jgi:hypothetical protein
LPFILLLLCFSNFLTEAQILQPTRYEHILSPLDLSFEVAPANDKGVFIYRRFSNIQNDALELYFLDTAFQKKWHGYLPVDRNYVIVGYKFFNNSLFFILRYHDLSKNDVQIIKLDHTAGTFLRYNIRNFIPFTHSEFHLTNRAALFGGYFNKTPVVIYYDFVTQQSKIVPGLFNEPGDLTQIKTYSDDSFDVLVTVRNAARKRMIWVRNYESNGNIVKSVKVEPEEGKNLVFGRAIRTTDSRQIVAGVYSNNLSEFSKGIFIANITESGEQQVTYYSYADLKNFFKYMRARHEKRVQSRIERRKIKGRKIRLNYRLLVHDLIPYQGQYILVGEAFYPKYIYPEGFGSYGGFTYGRFPRIQNGRIFDGYYYTHAVIAGFDASGKLMWDNSFEINDVRTFTLQRFVNLDAEEEKITLVYLFDNEIRSKIIKGDSVLEGKSSDLIKLKTQLDFTRKKDTEKSKLEYWHEGTFIAYGTQWINSDHRDLSRRRRVFFINKIVRK